MNQLSGLPEGRRNVYGPSRLWPRPPVPGQEGMGPTVTKIPFKLTMDFQRHIGTRLAANMAAGMLEPIFWSQRHQKPAELSDELILRLLFNTILSRSITLQLDPQDEVAFAPYLGVKQEGEIDFKIDFTALGRLRGLPKMYVTPTVTLGRIAADGTPRLIAMRINGMTLTPSDTNAWALGRHFLMQGAGLHGVLVHHTPLHFQFDAINAITNSLLPETHTLRRLLAPHFRFTLNLNKAALHSRLSILTNKSYLAYATFPGDEASIHHFQAAGWSGIEGNSAYPAYSFKRKPELLFGNLGIFLDEYYKVVRRFTARVAASIPADDTSVPAWAEAISEWLPGFPNAAEMQRDPEALADVAAMVIWGTSVVHSTEHCGLVDDIPLDAIALRLRMMPPVSRVMPEFDRGALTTKIDMFRQRVAWEVLVRDRPATRLFDTDYDFPATELQTANKDFLLDLERMDQRLSVRPFIPLRRIARSIQF
jgi:hypothetical protein